jgi:hypothetical protein
MQEVNAFAIQPVQHIFTQKLQKKCEMDWANDENDVRSSQKAHHGVAVGQASKRAASWSPCIVPSGLVDNFSSNVMRFCLGVNIATEVISWLPPN